MKPDFSEFSYGYAVTEELVSELKARIIAAPKFPSLYEEGKKGGGYDVSIPINGKPIFLQFKLSDCLERENAKEHVNGTLNVPYYRMHLRPLKHSDQHNLLLDLEASGESVFYIAPEFHLPTELNNVYLRKAVVQNSAAFAPSDIGHLPDNDEHYLVFKKWSTHAYLCSDNPEKIRKNSLEGGLDSLLYENDIISREVNESYFRDLNKSMLNTLKGAEERMKKYEKTFDIPGIENIINEREPMEVSAYMSRAFFDSEMLVIPNESNN